MFILVHMMDRGMCGIDLDVNLSLDVYVYTYVYARTNALQYMLFSVLSVMYICTYACKRTLIPIYVNLNFPTIYVCTYVVYKRTHTLVQELSYVLLH